MVMGTRRQGRRIALQVLYEYDTAHHDVEAVLERHTEDRQLGPAVEQFARDLVRGVLAHLGDVDAEIQGAAQEWPLSQMARIDENILTLAIFELLFNNAVPAKAAINAPGEVPKMFRRDTPSRFG